MKIITRDKKSKAASFRFEGEGSWTLFAGPAVDRIDLSTPIARGIGSGEVSLEVSREHRSYFLLESEFGKTILAERQLPMEGGYNFRDLGGIHTRCGRTVKWGKFIRADDLHSLTAADREYLCSLPLKTIVDFRTAGEIRSVPDKVPDSVENVHAYSIDPGDLMSLIAEYGENFNARSSVEIMKSLNEQLVLDPDSVEQYKKFFRLVQDFEKTPILYHCSAGKDRTGLASALILWALEVPEESILEDYLLSNALLEDKYAAYTRTDPALKPLFEVEKEFLQAAKDRICEKYGSVDAFLTEVLQVDLEKLREMFLDDGRKE